MAGFSKIDKALLSVSGVGVTCLTGSAAAWAWMTLADASLDPPATAPVIARIADLEGYVKSRHRETLAWTTTASKQELRDGDRVRTLGGAKAEIQYGSGIVISLDENTQITVYGPAATGSDRLIAVDVVDGTVRARVETGTALALRDATGRRQATVLPPETGAAEVLIAAPADPSGAIVLDVVQGGQVTVEDESGKTAVVTEAQPQVALLATPIPTRTPPPTPAPTPVPPLLKARLPVVVSESPDLRIRRPLPADVVAVSCNGRQAVIHENGDFEIEIYGLKMGINDVDLVYKKTDGSWARQTQRIQVR